MAPADPRPSVSAAPALDVIAMHGWASDGSQWQPWREATAARGWSWQSGERGYGERAPEQPRWRGEGRRVVVAHSMGPHLLEAGVLAEAEAVVLLASFARFVAPGGAGRAQRVALAGMAAALADASTGVAMLRRFLGEAAAPDPVEAMPPGPADAALTATGLERLQADLRRLEQIDSLPDVFPTSVPVLIVEAGADHIVAPPLRALLRQALPGAAVLEMAGAGHALLRAPLLDPVLTWLDQLVDP